MEARSITVGVFLLVLALLVRHSRSEEFCPNGCHCHYDHDSGDFYVDCSGLGLSELPHFPDTNVSIIVILSPTTCSTAHLFPFFPGSNSRFVREYVHLHPTGSSSILKPTISGHVFESDFLSPAFLA